MVISVFTGLGKSLMAKKYPQYCIDIDTVEYDMRYKKNMSDEDFYKSYTPILLQSINKYKYVLVSCSYQMINLLDKLGIEHIKVVPFDKNIHLLKMKLYRSNESKYIKWLDKNWDNMLKYACLFRLKTTKAILRISNLEDILFKPLYQLTDDNTHGITSFPMEFNPNTKIDFSKING